MTRITTDVPADLEFRPAQREELATLQSWFEDEDALTRWGGPGMRLTTDLNAFAEMTRFSELSSWSLLSQAQELLAFGQFYDRLSRVHLGRLAVAPHQRGKGLSKVLVSQLLSIGQKALGLNQGSLFVYQDNLAAINAYQGQGFVFQEYPGHIPGGLNNIRYMVLEKL